MSYLLLFLTAVFAVCIAWFIIPYLINLSQELHLFDVPDSRKLHTMPVPRLGGVSFMPAVIIAVAAVFVVALRLDIFPPKDLILGNAHNFAAYFSGVTMLYLVGMYDDIRGVSYKTKFLVQVVAAVILCVAGLWVADFENVLFIGRVPFWIGMPISIVFVVYITNALNLIDGVDGLAAGISVLAFLLMAVLSFMHGEILWAMLSCAYVGVLLVFFCYNVFGTNRKIFMGDAGSLTIGYTLGFLVLHFWRAHPVNDPVIYNVGIISLSPLIIPLFDVVRVFVARVKDGRNPFLPDKNHIHHKLIRAGLSGGWTMITLLLLTLSVVAINAITAIHCSQTKVLIIDIVFFILMHIVINFFIRRKGNEPVDHTSSPI